MLFTTPTEWVALGLTLFAGWLFGYASHSGGKKWRQQLEDEEVASATSRHEWETALRDAQDRIRTLEAERDAALAHTPTPEPPPPAESNGTSFLPLAAAAGAGAVAATLFHGDGDAETVETTPAVEEPIVVEEPAVAAEPAVAENPTIAEEPVKTWIPEGPPPPPLAMGAPEPAPYPAPQPITPDAPPQPTAPIAAAAAVPAFPQVEVKATEPDLAPPVAVPADHGEPPMQVSHDWLPPHLRSETPADN